MVWVNSFFTFKYQSKKQRFSLIPYLIVFAISISSCTTEATSTPNNFPVTMGDCFPVSVFTASDMQARIDCHPDKYKLKITEDTMVLFAFPNSRIDWVGPIFIIHIPSVSQIVVGKDGNLITRDYKSRDGQIAIEKVLNNSDLMASILSKAKEIKGEGFIYTSQP